MMTLKCSFSMYCDFWSISGMWIITTGIYSGVIKRVGEAVRDFGHTTEGRVVTLGIASWGSVQNKEHLIAPKVNYNKMLPWKQTGK